MHQSSSTAKERGKTANKEKGPRICKKKEAGVPAEIGPQNIFAFFVANQINGWVLPDKIV
jgi:hypothetical protein